MKWLTNNPKQSGVYWVRVIDPTLVGEEVSYQSSYFCTRWRLRYPSMRVSHYAIIKEPVPLGRNDIYADALGRIECVAQAEVLPNLATPPGKG